MVPHCWKCVYIFFTFTTTNADHHKVSSWIFFFCLGERVSLPYFFKQRPIFQLCYCSFFYFTLSWAHLLFEGRFKGAVYIKGNTDEILPHSYIDDLLPYNTTTKLSYKCSTKVSKTLGMLGDQGHHEFGVWLNLPFSHGDQEVGVVKRQVPQEVEGVNVWFDPVFLHVSEERLQAALLQPPNSALSGSEPVTTHFQHQPVGRPL